MIARKQLLNPALMQFEKNECRRLWLEGAARLGIEVSEEHGYIILRANGRELKVRDHLISFETAFACELVRDKPRTSAVLHEAGLKVPEGRAFSPYAVNQAVEYGLSIAPAVTKPCDGACGRGVSLNLTTRRQLQRGVRLAGLFGEVLVERFAPGESYRALVFRGRCLSILQRIPATVTGDGRNTIADLAAKETEARKGGMLQPLPTGKSAEALLRRSGLFWNSVLPVGVSAKLSIACSIQHGASWREWLPEMHPSLVVAVERAATVVGVVLAGVDIIIPDIRQTDYVINEVNTTPLLMMHYAPREHLDPIRDILLGYFEIHP
jgi:cyanophycin synthetase